jgi:hypothetical protein
MTKTQFTIDSLGKTTAKPRKSPAAVKTQTDTAPALTSWGKEYLKRLDRLHRVMREENFKFGQS